MNQKAKNPVFLVLLTILVGAGFASILILSATQLVRFIQWDLLQKIVTVVGGTEPILNAVAFSALIFTLLLQLRELALQRDSIEMQRQDLETSIQLGREASELARIQCEIAALQIKISVLQFRLQLVEDQIKEGGGATEPQRKERIALIEEIRNSIFSLNHIKK